MRDFAKTPCVSQDQISNRSTRTGHGVTDDNTNDKGRDFRSPGYLVATILDHTAMRVFPHIQAKPLGPQHYRLLRYLVAALPAKRNQRSYGLYTGIQRGHVRHILNDLVKMGLVQRGDDPRDRRTRQLNLTDLGYEVVSGLDPLFCLARLLDEKLTDSQRRQLSDLMVLIHQNWEEYAPSETLPPVLQDLHDRYMLRGKNNRGRRGKSQQQEE